MNESYNLPPHAFYRIPFGDVGTIFAFRPSKRLSAVEAFAEESHNLLELTAKRVCHLSKRMCYALVRVAILILLFSNCFVQAQEEETFFHSQVEPILRKRCFECHSHSSGEISGKLTLDWRTGWETGGDRGPAIVPNQPDASLLIRAIRHSDPKLKMPEEKLSDGEIDILTKWVEDGAFDDRKSADPSISPKNSSDWWSLKPLQQPKIPGDPGQHQSTPLS